MKLTAPYKCDYCQNTKGEANHWWLLNTSNGLAFFLRGWDANLADKEHFQHVCSEQCAVKALSKWMATTPQRPTEAI
jgi:hypothetical protein